MNKNKIVNQKKSVTSRLIVGVAMLLLACEPLDLERQLLVSTLPYQGTRIANPDFQGQIVDLGPAPVTNHGFVWDIKDAPDLNAPQGVDLGARAERGPFTSLLTGMLPSTVYYVRAYATTAQGQTVYGETVQYQTPQQETPLSSTEGGVGTIIIIVGNFNFNTVNEITVKFGNGTAEIVSATNTNLIVKVPEINNGTVKISVTTPSGTVFIPDDFTVIDAPAIEAITPATGAPGSTIIIRGTNFITNATYNTVLFDNIPARVTDASATEIVTTVPVGLPAGPIAVKVQSGALVSALPRNFMVSTPPAVTDFAPKSGPVGTRITIIGTNFGSINDTQVTIGEVNAIVSGVTATTLSVLVPTNLSVGASVPIMVKTNGTTLPVTPNFSVTTAGATAVIVNNSITTPTTWVKIAGPGEVDYRVTNNIQITSELTIAPGVIIEVDNGREINVTGSNSVLIAKGTATNPIVFTGRQKQPGFWNRLRFSSATNPANELDYVEISYAGLNGTGNLLVDFGSRVKVSNSNISNSGGYGAIVGSDSRLDLTSSALFNNAIIPLRMAPVNIQWLAATNRMTGGNGRNAIQIEGGTINNFAETTWPTLQDNTPYFITGDVDIASGVRVDPGNIITFDYNRSLRINGSSAYLAAKGTSVSKIIFTGADRSIKGSWNQLRFSSSNNPKNELDHVEVSHGGSGGISQLLVDFGSRLKIANTKIANSSSGGLRLEGDCRLDRFSFNSFENNTNFPASVPVHQLGILDANSTFSGNGLNLVEVYSSSLNEPSAETSWPAFEDGTSIYISGNIFVNSGVRVQPGAIFVFNANVGLEVSGSNSYLVAKGTGQKPIVFTGRQQSAGYWSGLKFNGSPSVNNEFENAQISFGGGQGGNLNMSFGSRLSVRNSTITNSSGWGIFKSGGGEILNSDAATVNTFSNNALGNVN
ncbi:MAG: IPT/TIG domain-containing protein [Cyclobacteriaceae bacterium]|nr:IPT/TIG domain-containing protein [Cyclobacteriaceae bacterium]